MNLRPYRNALMLSAALALGPWVGNATARLSLNPAQTQLRDIGTTLALASRRQFRLGSRSSRYRVGAFRRGGNCLAEGQKITPLVPPSTDADTPPPADGHEAETDTPIAVDLTTATRPVFFIHVPPTTEPTSVQFTLQDAPGTEELANFTFELPEEPGVIGVQPMTLSRELPPGEPFTWQMAMQCNAEDLDGNPVISGWIMRTAQTAALQGNTFNQAATLAEAGIWQDSPKPA